MAHFIVFNNDAGHGHSSNFDRIKKNQNILHTFHVLRTYRKESVVIKKKVNEMHDCTRQVNQL